MAHQGVGREVVKAVVDAVSDIGTAENQLKLMGRSLIVIVAPGVKKKDR